MRWFGQSWGAEVCDPDLHAPTPIGELCMWCDELIAEDDAGVILPYVTENATVGMPHHVNCFLRSVVGSVGHQMGHACNDPDAANDPPEMTRRQAADAAVAMFYGAYGEDDE